MEQKTCQAKSYLQLNYLKINKSSFDPYFLNNIALNLIICPYCVSNLVKTTTTTTKRIQIML